MKTTRTDIINRVARLIGAETYMEVGVRDPRANYLLVDVPKRYGCDPKYKGEIKAIWPVESDVAFAEAHATGQRFDIVFIDGDHSDEQSKRDLLGALRCLASGGFVVMHDVIPETEEQAAAEREAGYRGGWCGEVWRTWAYARSRRDLLCALVDIDHGVGLIRKGRTQDVIDPSAATWQTVREWGNVIGLGEMEGWYR